MRSVRVRADEVVVGDVLLTVGDKRQVNARVLEIAQCQPGQHVRGPRGGRYALTHHGAAERLVLVTAHARPIVGRTTGCTVLREADGE